MHKQPWVRSILVAILVNGLACGNGVGGRAEPETTRTGESRVSTSRAAVQTTDPTWTLQSARPDDVIPSLNYASSVDPSGAASVTVPIWMPTGRNGVRPELALSYSSKAGDGLLGLGFSMSGLSSIERCWKRPAVDGAYSRTVTEDEYCLNGTRLLRVPNTLKFHPEGSPDTLVTIVSGTSEEPIHFEVRTRDGRIQTFGARDNSADQAASRAVLGVPEMGQVPHEDLTNVVLSATPRVVAWYLDRVSDRWSNFYTIDYERTEAGGVLKTLEIRPTRIKYTGNVGLAPSREVSFTYRASSRPRVRRIAQVPIKIGSVLTGIAVKAEERVTTSAAPGPMRLLREYRISYLPPGARSLDRVDKITECFAAAQGTVMPCGAPLQFTWSGLNTPRIPTFTKTDIGPVEIQDPTAWGAAFMDVLDAAVGDFDGDGFDDYLVRTLRRPNATGGSQTQVGGSFLPNARWLLARGSASGLIPPVEVALPGSAGSFNALSARVMDLDSDGRAEVLLVDNGEALAVPLPSSQMTDALVFRQDQHYDVFRFTGSDFVARGVGETLNTAQVTDRPDRSASLTMGDVDGDGLVDIVTDDAPVGMNPQPQGIWTRFGAPGLAFSNGSARQLPATSMPVSFWELAPTTEKHFVDLNGNGSPELVGRVSGLLSGSNFSALDGDSTSLFAIGHRDASGRQDVWDTRLHADNIGQSNVAAHSQGAGCAGNFKNYFSRVFADVDGDGLRDSIAFPNWDRDTCGTVRDWRGFVFTSLNLGGVFPPPVAQVLPARPPPTPPPLPPPPIPPCDPTYMLGRIGPSMVEEQSTFLTDRNGVERNLADRETRPARSLDNGLRIVDFDGDGRDDLLSVGELTLGVRQSVCGRSMFLSLSNGNGFENPVALPIAAARGMVEDFANAGPNRGNGPRSVRMGDFNGDGLFDIALVGDPNSPLKNLIVHQQNPRPPDAIVAASAGPQAPTEKFEYARASPSTPAILLPGGCTPAGDLVCPKQAGFVVSKYSREANHFDSASPEFLDTTFTYQGPTHDKRGRGGLGFTTVTSETSGLKVSTTVDFTIKLSLPNGGYVYSRPSVRTETVTVPDGNYSRVTSRTVQLEPSSSSGFHRASMLVTEVAALGSVVTSDSEETTTFDQYDNPETNSKQWKDGANVFSSIETRKSSNGADEYNWLLDRYERVEIESNENGNRVIRTTQFEYEPGSPEIKVVTAEPDEDWEDESGPSGFRLQTTSWRDNFGNVTSVEQTNKRQTRVIETKFDGRDAIFPVSQAIEGQVTRRYWHAGFSLPFAEDDANLVRSRGTFDEYLRPFSHQNGVLATDDTTIGGGRSDFRYNKIRKSAAAFLRAYWACADSNTAGTSCEQIDPSGRPIQKVWPHLNGVTTQDLTYDVFGNLVAESMPRNSGGETPAFVTRTFDRLGRIRSQTRPGETLQSAGFVQIWSYPVDLNSRLAQRIDHLDERLIHRVVALDRKGRAVTDSTFDAAAQQREVRVEHEFGPFDQLEAIIHPAPFPVLTPAPAPLVTRTRYDRLGRAEFVSDVDRGDETRFYSAFGELKRTEDASGGVTTITRDILGRPTLIETPENGIYKAGRSGSAQRTTYEWDTAPNGLGKVAGATSGDGVRFVPAYDAFGRLESRTWSVDGTDYLFSTAYDSVGRPQQLRYPDSGSNAPFAVSFERGDNGAINSIFDVSGTLGSGAPTKLIWHAISSHPSGALSEQQFGTNTRDTRRFDAAHQLRFIESRNTQSNAVLQRLSYGLGAGGFVTQKTDLSNIQATESYEHDFLGRLSLWTVDQNCQRAQWRYHYDDLGNLRRKERIQGPGTDLELAYTTVSDSSQPHAVKTATEGGNTSTYSYLRSGQTESSAGVTIDWTPFGRPMRMSDGWSTTLFEHDAANQRVRSIETSTVWLRDVVTLGGLFEQELTRSGSVFTYNVIGPEGVVAQIVRDQRNGGNATRTAFLHPDHLGNADSITDETGTVLERIKFEPFGERRHAWAIAHPIADSLVLNESLGFTGHRNADRFGKVDMKGRIYDPKIGRFMSPDPFLFGGSEGLNRHSYVRNSPIMSVDPSGFADAPTGGARVPGHFETIVAGQKEKPVASPCGVDENGFFCIGDTIVVTGNDVSIEKASVDDQATVIAAPWTGDDFDAKTFLFVQELAQANRNTTNAVKWSLFTMLPGSATSIAIHEGDGLGLGLALDAIGIIPIGKIFGWAKGEISAFFRSLLPDVGEYAARGMRSYAAEVGGGTGRLLASGEFEYIVSDPRRYNAVRDRLMALWKTSYPRQEIQMVNGFEGLRGGKGEFRSWSGEILIDAELMLTQSPSYPGVILEELTHFEQCRELGWLGRRLEEWEAQQLEDEVVERLLNSGLEIR